MTQQQLQIFTNLWDLPLATRIISGVGKTFVAQGFLELGVVTSWISQIPSLSTDLEEIEKSVPELEMKTTQST